MKSFKVVAHIAMPFSLVIQKVLTVVGERHYFRANVGGGVCVDLGIHYIYYITIYILAYISQSD